ncbi:MULTISPECIES: polyphosphate kinase 2 [unclassified Arthrobacter]|uniref:polyphosphate kinase 2 n=1 Tax=unclassified Arthrobacter TaxID=235627 RepID=UPI0014928F82|nr:polyphosphate kinase 2 [Arthrobacter sp. AET 35A]MBE0009645.1 polyphosphate kinase 2 [Arthrobacter sp. AET 35A]NOJ63397.1 polyphosphate kinase 2 [Arthrobacter sp. 147(2020)]
MVKKTPHEANSQVLSKKDYEKELLRLQEELVALQEWVRATGTRLVVIFEGRDTAGKGGTIQRISSALNPRFCRVVALPAPTEREKSQWYFQRYIAHLPAAGEMVLFDRSWYNRAGVEKVMGYCSDEQYAHFVDTAPMLEESLISDGIVLVKYWLSLSDSEQRRRFQRRIDNPAKRWKLSPMDLEAQARWVDYAEAKDKMFEFSDTEQSPWWVVDADNKKEARLNLIAHLLSVLPYERPMLPDIELPERQNRIYERPPLDHQRFVPQRYKIKTSKNAPKGKTQD